MEWWKPYQFLPLKILGSFVYGYLVCPSKKVHSGALFAAVVSYNRQPSEFD